MLIVVGALALAAPSWAGEHATPALIGRLHVDATPVAEKAVGFKLYTDGYVREGFLGAVRLRNRILIARTYRQALRWDKWIYHPHTTAPQASDFSRHALIGVFLLDRAAANGVIVSSASVSNGTLLLTIHRSGLPPASECGPGVDAPIECTTWGPPTPLRLFHPFTLVTVAKAAMADVRRIVVTHEVEDPPGCGVPLWCEPNP